MSRATIAEIREHRVTEYITGNFELFWNNRLCKYLVLGGGSKDRNYGDFLRPYTTTEEDIERIIMLDRISFPRDMATLAWKMTTIRSPSLFHNCDAALPTAHETKPVQARLTPPDSPRSAEHVTSGSNSGAGNSGIGSSGSGLGSSGINNRRSGMIGLPTLHPFPTLQAPRQLVSRASKQFLKLPTFTTTAPPTTTTTTASASASSTQPSTSQIMNFNKSGHRLDEPLRYDPKIRDQLRDRAQMPCFDHHLGNRTCKLQNCQDEHGGGAAEALLAAPSARETLRWMARSTPCKDPRCADPACYLGHVCPFDGLCCEDVCEFGREMHNVDTTVADKRVVKS